MDRSSPLPLYVQLENSLMERIRVQQLEPGDQLPTEAEIEVEFAVSRATIRTALNHMVADGYVERIQGLGSFVARPRLRHRSLLNSFTENMRTQGYVPQRRLLQSVTVRPDDEARSSLKLPRGECLFIARILLADGSPIAVSRTWLPVASVVGKLELFTAEALESGSLYELLMGDQVGLVLQRGVETVRAALVDTVDAPLLERKVGSPALVVRRTSFLPSGRPVEWSVMTFAGDRYEYHLELT